MAIIDLDHIPELVRTEATWEEYEALLEATQDRHLRITYDLAVEVDVSRSSINRMGIYARLGIPEVWRYAKGRLRVYKLDESGRYHVLEQSPTFPDIPLEMMERLVETGNGSNVPEMVWALQDWLGSH